MKGNFWLSVGSDTGGEAGPPPVAEATRRARREMASRDCSFGYVLRLSKSARWAKGVKVEG